MSERFDFNLSLGEDEHKGLIFENGQVMKTIDVTYLLNSQDAEIKKLKKEILWWKYKCGEDINGDK